MSKHDRGRSRFRHESANDQVRAANEYIWLPGQEFPTEITRQSGVPACPAVPNFQVGPLCPAQIAELLTECRRPGGGRRVILVEGKNCANTSDGRLRLHARGPDDKTDKLPPPHSITSSARARRAGGIVSPRP